MSMEAARRIVALEGQVEGMGQQFIREIARLERRVAALEAKAAKPLKNQEARAQ